MRRLTYCCCMVLLVGCSKSGEEAAMDSTATATPAAAPQPIALADVAGTWAMRTMAPGTDSAVASFNVVAGADTSGWSIQFPNRPPIPVRVVSVAGDSIITAAGPYESILRKGVQVTTQTVMRLSDGMLVGTTVAHYATSGADSMITLHSEGMRAP